jgi:hypothetical protein
MITRLLRLHTHRGTVWYGDDNRLAVDSGQAAPSFDAVDLDAADACRLVGTAANARLVVRLGGRRVNNPGHLCRLQLAAPRLLGQLGPDPPPAAVLRLLWQPPASRDLGGVWSEARSWADLAGYALTAAVRDNSPHVASVLRAHPAWPALSFLPHAARRRRRPAAGQAHGPAPLHPPAPPGAALPPLPPPRPDGGERPGLRRRWRLRPPPRRRPGRLRHLVQPRRRRPGPGRQLPLAAPGRPP